MWSLSEVNFCLVEPQTVYLLMDSFRFGEDYHNRFDPKAYLNYYNEVEKNEFSLRCLHEFWSKMARRNARVLDFGGGPVIHDLISAAPSAEEIIFAEYSEENRKEVATWREKSPDAHDWSPYFKFVVQRFEGKGSDEALIREAELRKKIIHILPCDIALEDPVKWPSTWTSQLGSFDVVTTSLCIEAAVKSETEYRDVIAKLKSYLKPGGYTVSSHVQRHRREFLLCRQGKILLLFRERESNPRNITPRGIW